MRVSFHTLGCKVNQYETAALRRFFAAAGFFPVEGDGGSDVIVVNSCTVTAESDRKTRQLLRRLRRENPDAVLVLCGCYPQAFPAEAAALAQADIVAGAGARGALPEKVSRFLRDRARLVEIAPHTGAERFEEMSAEDFGERTRAFLKIEDGCENYCSYCIIPTARGPVRSKPLAEIQREAALLAAEGRREVVLTGINLSAYGRETGDRFSMAAALCAAEPGIARVRFGSIEPDTVTAEDLRLLAEGCGGKICPQFHLSLQSGSDAVLRRMGRRYDSAQYLEVVAAFRRYFPGAAFTTDMMVGFPGETDAEHAESMAFARRVGFARIHVFAYSRRAGTAADLLPEQLPQEKKRARSRELLETAAALRARWLESKVGGVEQVLFESAGPGGQTGYTMDYTPVTVPHPADLRGRIAPVRITGVLDDGCVGVLSDPAAEAAQYQDRRK